MEDLTGATSMSAVAPPGCRVKEVTDVANAAEPVGDAGDSALMAKLAASGTPAIRAFPLAHTRPSSFGGASARVHLRSAHQ